MVFRPSSRARAARRTPSRLGDQPGKPCPCHRLEGNGVSAVSASLADRRVIQGAGRSAGGCAVDPPPGSLEMAEIAALSTEPWGAATISEIRQESRYPGLTALRQGLGARRLSSPQFRRSPDFADSVFFRPECAFPRARAARVLLLADQPPRFATGGRMARVTSLPSCPPREVPSTALWVGGERSRFWPEQSLRGANGVSAVSAGTPKCAPSRARAARRSTVHVTLPPFRGGSESATKGVPMSSTAFSSRWQPL